MTEVKTGTRLSASIWSGHFTKKEGDAARCRASVPDGGRSSMSHQCSRRPTVFRDCADPVGRFGFCKAHDPVVVAERKAAKEAQWRREWDERDARTQRRAKRIEAEKGCIAVLREIAAGHNDPRSIAQEALAALDAQADRNPEGHDPAEGHGRNDESPVGNADAPKGSIHG